MFKSMNELYKYDFKLIIYLDLTFLYNQIKEVNNLNEHTAYK